jgi:hypothetical protein
MYQNSKIKEALIFFFFLFVQLNLFSIGTFAEGSVVAKLIQFESRGIIFNSYEGVLEITTFNKEEKCDESKDECFAPIKQKINFSVRPENAELVNFLSKSVNQEVLFGYRVHRITAIALSSEMEVISSSNQISNLPPDHGDKFAVSKSGSKRNFSVSGKVIQLDYQGTFIGTYEGLYLDEARGKVHAFSVTSEQMSRYAQNSMKSNQKYNMGISVAFATGFRKSDYDLFEINYREPAGGINTSMNIIRIKD